VVLPILLAYLSTTAPAATASARAISWLSARALKVKPPVVERSRLRRVSTFSSATPTATDAPTAVSLAVTSPLAVEIVLVIADEAMVILSVALIAEPVPT